MYTKEIKSLDQWFALVPKLQAAGFHLWIHQYGIDRSEGLHTFFWAKDKPDVELFTHNVFVGEEMLKYPR